MSDLITMREYAALNNIKLETVKTRVKQNQLPVVRFGKSVMIDKNTPWEVRKKTGRIPNAVKEQPKVGSRKSKLKVKIVKAYYVAVEDSSGKEITSDFTFLTKAEAVKIGEKMKKEMENKLK